MAYINFKEETAKGKLQLAKSKIIDTYLVDLEFNDKLKTKIDEKTFFDKIKLRKKDKNEYEGGYKIYETIANKFKENNLKNNFGEYYYQCRKVQRKSLKPFPKMLSYLDWIFMGYGERVIYSLMTSLIIIIIFSFVYLFIGIDIEGEILKLTFSSFSKLSLKEILRALNEGFTISVGMFAGSGIVEGAPVPEAYLIASLEEIVGFIMMGTIIATITRKFVR